MLVDAVFDNGQIKFLQPMQFAHKRFHVQIDIPVEEIVVEETSNDDVAEFKRLTDTLFGSDYCYVQEKSDKEILAEVLSEKYA